MFEQDFIDFVEFLNINEVKYIVVGAHALAFHGRPRHTGDLDIWIKPEIDNARKIIKVLDDFGFSSPGLTEKDFLKEDYVTQLGYPPLRIDILNSISGVEFEDAYQGRIIGREGNTEISFINIADFIANKLAMGRPKDIGDVNTLKYPR